jgi:hypothetical protein
MHRLQDLTPISLRIAYQELCSVAKSFFHQSDTCRVDTLSLYARLRLRPMLRFPLSSSLAVSKAQARTQSQKDHMYVA